MFDVICYIKSRFSALDQVRKQQLEVRQILQELDKRHREIDYLVDRAKNASIDPKWENDVSVVSVFQIFLIRVFVIVPRWKKTKKVPCIA